MSEHPTDGVFETTRPKLVELAVNGTRLTLTYSEALDPSSVPGADQFTVWINFTAVRLAATDAVMISGRVVTLTLATAVVHGDYAAVRYVVPTGLHATPIQDLAYNAAYGIDIRSVENTTPDSEAPVLRESEVNGTRLELTYDETLDPNSVPDPGQFTVTVNGTAVNLAAVDAVGISGSVVTLTLASPVSHGDSVALTYVVPTGPAAAPVQNTAGNAAPGFDVEGVRNSTPGGTTPESPDPTDPPATCFRNLTISLRLTISQGLGIDPVSDSLKVYRVAGHEAISQPFCYAIDLVCVDEQNNPLELDADGLLDKSATLQITVADAGVQSSRMSRNVHGIIEGLTAGEHIAAVDTGTVSGNRYRVFLVPRMASLARNRHNRIFATTAERTLEELIANTLLARGPDYPPGESGNRAVLAEDDFRIDIDNDRLPQAALSNVTQNGETDLAFVQRLCEHHGVFFFFASNTDDTAGVVIFGNTNGPFGVIRLEPDPNHSTTAPAVSAMDDFFTPPATYRDEHKLEIDLTLVRTTGLVAGSQYTAPTEGEPARLRGVLCEFKSVDRFRPRSVQVISDQAGFHNEHLKPTVTLDSDGRGIHVDYDTHFSTRESGDAFARIRSQEIRAASRYCIGLTNSPCVAPGRTFTKRPDGNSPPPDGATYPKYLVTAVEVEVRQAHAGLDVTVDGEVVQTGFGNRFRCIEFDETGDFVYRPPRVTPVPRLHGVQTAYIGTGDTGEDARPVLDENGAYHIYSPFLDERVEFVGADSMLTIDRLSKALRKGEPYAGDGVGMHFPLKRDTEVLVAYRNGDPDRPVIAAAMPGSLDHASPVSSENPTSHVIETSSGARFEIHDDDTDSGARIALRSRGASDQASYVRLGKADTTGAGDSGTLEDHYAQNAVTVSEGEGVDGIALYTADNIREAAKADKITEVQGTIRVEAHEDIVGRSVQRHLLRGRRMVIVSGTARDEPAEGETIDAAGESLQLEDDDMMLSSKRNLYISAHGDIHETTPHSVTTEVGGDEIARTFGDSISHHYGNTMGYIRGSSHSAVLGATNTVLLGLAVWGAGAGGLNLRAGSHLLFGFGVGLVTRHQLRWNIWTVKHNATEGIQWVDHKFADVASSIFAETASLSSESTQTDCEIATDVVDAANLLVHT